MLKWDDRKLKLADAIIDNNGTKEDLEREAERLMRLWTKQ
jgi:dephospho-CoA kinase